MGTTETMVTTCDLCGYGDGYGALNDFVRLGAFDFCVWCADATPTTRIECGAHITTIYGPNEWLCSCGATYGFTVLMMRLRGVPLAVMDAVPDLGRATASVHVQS